MQYVTYDADGNLTGCYLQDLVLSHMDCHLEVSAEDALNWPLFRMNDDRDGLILAAVPDVFPLQAQSYLDSVRTMRERILIRLNGYGGQLLLAEPPACAEEKALCSTIIQGLLDITTIPAVTEATDLEQLQTAIKSEYARLVGMASEDMVKAFRKVDL